MTGSHIALFAGVGMDSFMAERSGYKTIATAEIDPFCRSVLKRRFPDASHFEDVRAIRQGDLALYRPQVYRPLLITGGFPCQDVSAIGAAAGLGGARSGLWSEFVRVIREFRPDKVLIENSPMLRSRGLDVVLCDLAALVYDAVWDCLPAASAGAPHLRDRVWIVATPSSVGTLPEWLFSADYFIDGRHTGVFADGTHAKVTRLPRAGTMHGWAGAIREDAPSATLRDSKRAIQGHLFPTPRRAANEWRTTRNAPSHGNGHGKTLAGELNDLERAAGRTPAKPSESAGNINPEWVEWLMGLPGGWTDPSVPNSALKSHDGWDAEPAGVPRTLADAPHRRARLNALGNGLVPQVAQVALTMKED